MKKILTFLLIITVFTTGMVMPTKKAEAVTILGISGVVDVVIDPVNIGTSVAGWLQEWGRFALEKAGEIIISTLKKRLLDRIVQQTIEWIQGNGSPRFIQDPGGFLRDAADAAVGDTIQSIGLGNLCSSNLKTQIRVQLEQPTFDNQVSCTLTDALGNVEGAVEQFSEDFRNGSWIAYNETLKPQNNRWGLRLMTQVELAKNQAQQQQQAESEISSGDGFLSQRRCLGWEKKVDPASETEISLTTAESEDYYLESPDGVRYTGNDRPPGSDWVCIQSQVVTPGSTIGESVAKSIGSDIDYLVNADDLSTYVSAIADALINRLTKEAVTGLAGVYDATQGSDPMGSSSSSCEDLGPPGDPAREACEDYQEHQDDVEDAADEGRDDLEGYRDRANEQSENSKGIEACDDLPNVGDIRQQCREEYLKAPAEISFGETDVLVVGSEYTQPETTITLPGNNLDRYTWFFSSCAGSCPSLSDDSGSLTGGEETIIGPTFTPENEGSYSLIIEVIDEEEDITTSTLSLSTSSGGDEGDNDSDESEEGEDNTENYNLDLGDDHLLTVGVEHTHEGTTASNETGNLDTYFWSFESCPGSCPSMSNDSGTIDETGSSINIPGPTFRPNGEGFYEILLEINDVDGNSVTDSIIEQAL